MNYIIAGPPGSGKTTLAHKRMRRGDVMVDVDYIYRAFSGRPLYDKPEALHNFVLNIRDRAYHQIAGEAVGDAYIIIASGNRDFMQSTASRFDAELIVLEVPADECKERVANDSRRDSNTDWNSLIDKWWADYNKENIDSGRGVNMRIERRYYNCELRVDDHDAGRRIVGYGAVFNQFSLPLGWSGQFREIIRPGAFKKTIQEADIRSLFNHDANYVLGRNRSGTLTLVEDDQGLRIEVDPPDAQWARDLMVSIDRGDVNQMSFGFETIRDEWFTSEEGETTRELIEVRLWDVGPVTFPAYPQTDAQLRQLMNYPDAPSEAGHPSDMDSQPGAVAQVRIALRRRQLDLLEIE